MRVTFCGICHSDLHAVDALAPGSQPFVPGHEFVGEVAAVGADVTRFRVGDAVAVGNIVDSCGVCPACRDHREPYCAESPTTTWGGTLSIIDTAAGQVANVALGQYAKAVAVSPDGRRVYVTNSLYQSWDEQFYPDGIRGWIAKIDADPKGGCALDPKFFLDTCRLRPHKVHLEGGDASSDSYCFS